MKVRDVRLSIKSNLNDGDIGSNTTYIPSQLRRTTQIGCSINSGIKLIK
jgi:hypothetical protein